MDLILSAPFDSWSPPISASTDGEFLAFGNANAMYVFDTSTGKAVNEFEGEMIAISPDGERVLVHQGTYTQLIERATEGVLKTFPGEFLWPSWRFSSDGTRFIAGSFDGATYVYDLETGEKLHELRGQHYNPVVTGVADNPDTLLIASWDTSRVLNLGDRTEIDPPCCSESRRWLGLCPICRR